MEVVDTARDEMSMFLIVNPVHWIFLKFTRIGPVFRGSGSGILSFICLNTSFNPVILPVVAVDNTATGLYNTVANANKNRRPHRNDSIKKYKKG